MRKIGKTFLVGGLGLSLLSQLVAGDGAKSGLGADDGAKSGLGAKDAGPTTISGVIFYDLNENGVQDPGEPGKAGVEVSLYDASGAPIEKTYTDVEGRYLFNVPVGDYQIGHGGIRTLVSARVGGNVFDGPIFIDRTDPQIRGLSVLDPRVESAQNLIREPRDGRTERRQTATPYRP